jgi:xylan 1,4-beta-xylosidase
MTPRPFEDGAVKCCLLNEYDHKERSYTIKGSSSPLSKVESRNIVLRRQTSFKFSYEVTLDVPKLLDDQSAGITGYYDENTFFEFGVTKKADGVYIYSKEHIGDEDRISFGKETVPSDVEMICFKMDTDRFTRTLSYSTLAGGLMSENEVFKVLSDVDYLCDEGLKRGKRFTGALVGMYAVRGALDLTVHFHNEKYEDLK